MFEFKFPAVLLRGLCVHMWEEQAKRQGWGGGLAGGATMVAHKCTPLRNILRTQSDSDMERPQ